VLAREVVAPGTPGLAQVAARFPGVVGADGQLDRAKLGARVFADPAERAALNALLHPRIAQAFLERTQALAEAGVPRVLYDAPLLIENGLHTRMEGVVLVAVPRDVQRERLMRRDGLSAEAAEARLASQLPLEKKLEHATWVVDNAGNLEETRAQVERIWKALVARD
jgi:dephospho-CoA kinase